MTSFYPSNKVRHLKKYLNWNNSSTIKDISKKIHMNVQDQILHRMVKEFFKYISFVPIVLRTIEIQCNNRNFFILLKFSEFFVPFDKTVQKSNPLQILWKYNHFYVFMKKTSSYYLLPNAGIKEKLTITFLVIKTLKIVQFS